ncbi:hypothetical protein BRD17_04285 [Halobacteriales archaeon SW_7_68_16]|nr:MAG: hypothetical protein BRD17_04285 [Halobacteriales archaeon SW_7_68_16]
MPVPKSAFDDLYPVEFYDPTDLFDPDRMYTVPEIARLLQGLEPEADLSPEQEAPLVDWAIPWLMDNAGDLVIADPRGPDDPGRYGLATDDAPGAGADADADDGEDPTDDAGATRDE